MKIIETSEKIIMILNSVKQYHNKPVKKWVRLRYTDTISHGDVYLDCGRAFFVGETFKNVSMESFFGTEDEFSAYSAYRPIMKKKLG